MELLQSYNHMLLDAKQYDNYLNEKKMTITHLFNIKEITRFEWFRSNHSDEAINYELSIIIEHVCCNDQIESNKIPTEKCEK